MTKTTRFYPRVQVDTAATGAVGQAGGVLLTQTVVASGLGRELSAALSPWRRPFAVHDPAKVLVDLAIALAIGGTHLDDAALLRAEPDVYGLVASDPTITRTIATLAQDAAKALAAIDAARSAARANAWVAAGGHAPDHGSSAKTPLIVDLDATLITAHSDKENARATYKRGYGFHPLCAFVDHGSQGTGEPLSILLRPGNAGSDTAADHITVIKQALRQLPGHTPGTRPGRKVLIRTDNAGCTHAVLTWMHGQRLSYSVGFTLPEDTPDLLARIPEHVWAVAIDADAAIRKGAWVAELSGLLDLTGWPPGMRVIARKERPHPGAQLRFDDVDGMRITAFATNTPPGGRGTQLADLELRHRRRARCEDRIRISKDTGLRAMPLKGYDQNRIWCAIVALAGDLLAWMQMLALHGHPARRWEPKSLRVRLFAIPATLAHRARRVLLHLSNTAPWAGITLRGITRLHALAAPG